MNEAWECPRCRRINAPFNPTCFCSPDEEVKASKGSEHIMDAERYLKDIPGSKIADIPNGYKKLINQRCLICNGVHMIGVSCLTLKVE